MNLQDCILEVIRAHPDGITTPEISHIVYPGKTLYAQTYNKAHRLEIYGLVRHRQEYRICNGRRTRVAVWTPL